MCRGSIATSIPMGSNRLHNTARVRETYNPNAMHHPQNSSGLLCELCHNVAGVFCQADEAVLCNSCDMKVHSANFLASRHVRAVLCCVCSGDTHLRVCGSSPYPPQLLCREHYLQSGGNSQVAIQTAPRRLVAITHDLCEAQDMHGHGQGMVSQTIPGSLRHDEPYEEGKRNEKERDNGASSSPHSVLSVEREDSYCTKRPSESSGSSSSSTEIFNEVDAQQLKAKRRRDNTQFDASEDDCASSTSNEEPKEGRNGKKCRYVDMKCSEAQKYGMDTHCTGHPSSAVLGEQASQRLQRVLAQWAKILQLSSDNATCQFAFHLFKRVLGKLRPGMVATEALRVTLAACLWIAVKFEGTQKQVPKASRVGQVTGVKPVRLVEVETQILNLVNWHPLEGWSNVQK